MDNKARSKVIKYVVTAITVIVVILGIFLVRSIIRIENYKINKLYEELTLTDKIAAKIKGYDFYTKEEQIEKGWILSDEKKEAKEIVDIFSPISEYIVTKDNEDTDIKIKKCNEVLALLDKENASGRITTNNLINLMNDCENTTDYYLKMLEALKVSDLSKYSTCSDKMIENFKKVNSDLSRLGFTK